MLTNNRLIALWYLYSLTNYYVSAVLKVLEGEALEASDQLSFNAPAINSEGDWQKLVDKALMEAECFALQIERLKEEQLFEDFTDPKYGNYFRNVHGIIKHTHYHLGQIALIKKILNVKE
ncbi:hypothetical protein AQ505_18580 [Pedobacter sp. PACM 27299]|uniref:hypothetical protein n=1 Tax=Pedobacter sp. PACM 27299 TaxID=1727164 RepID=UPI000705BC1E|nr:hypothetical protein [Pedobacter sp. PACM 27299]ALL07315.1 hypothetical protein AQ505_18580 [Pedobacter sp. PACM 27299]